jgi:mycofactocin biosynthesis protein MftB
VRGLLTVTATVEGVAGGADVQAFDPALAWRLHSQVAVRPEHFGALLYHFGTRKLSFLKSQKILEIVNSLGEHPDARAACRAAGIEDAQQEPYMRALGTLVTSNMLVCKEIP